MSCSRSESTDGTQSAGRCLRSCSPCGYDQTGATGAARDDAADEKKELDRCAGMRYNENSHSSPSQAICGGFVCTGIRCREQLDTGHSAQRGKNLKGLAAVESISVLEAARQLGRSKNTVKYWVRKLPPETVSKDEKGRLWISSAGLELLREQLKEPDERNHQEPDERTTDFSAEPPRTGRKPPKNHPKPDEKPDENHLEPDEKPLSTGRKPDEEPPTTTQRTTAAEQLDALREQLDHLRDDLSAAQQAAAVATAERDAERRRADAAELREREQAQTVTDLTAALRTAQQQAADLTAALTAAQALHAGTLRGQLETHEAEPAAVPTPTAAATAEPAPDQTGTQSGDGADDQSKPKRRGLFARLFGRR